FDMLKEPHCRKPLIVAAAANPTEARVAVSAETIPSEVFVRQERRLNHHRTVPRRKWKVRVIFAPINPARAKCQRRNPGPISLVFLQCLITEAEGGIHQSLGGLDGLTRVKRSARRGGVTERHIRRPFWRHPVVDLNHSVVLVKAVAIVMGIHFDAFAVTSAPNR